LWGDGTVKKVLYFLPAVLVCWIYGFMLFILEGTFDAVIDAVQSAVFLYILLPVTGSVLLAKNKWWGSLFGAGMGLLLIWNNLQYTGHQHVNIDLPLGIFVVLYYSLCGIICGLGNRNTAFLSNETERKK